MRGGGQPKHPIGVTPNKIPDEDGVGWHFVSIGALIYNRRREIAESEGEGVALPNKLDGTEKAGWLYAAACALSLAAFTLSGGILNAVVYSSVAEYFGLARDIATAVGAASFLAIGVVARAWPRALDVRAVSAACLVLLAVEAPLFAAATSACNPALATIALCMRSIARNWALALFAMCLLKLGSVRRTALVVVVGMFVGQVVGSGGWSAVDPAVALGLVSALVAAPMLWCAVESRDAFATLSACESASVLELTNPRSFLGASNGLFQCAFLFACAGGFALAFNEVDNVPLATNVMSAALVALVLYVVLVRGSRQEDTLFSFSVMLVMAGFLLVPFDTAGSGTAANSLINLGENCFDVLMYLVVASIGRRNLFAALPVFCFARCVSQLGTDVGAMAGHASNAASSGSESIAMAFALAFVFAFFGFLWVKFRAFSFSDVISGIERVEASHVAACAAATAETDSDQLEPEQSAETIDDRCERIGLARGLTPREREIFAMLAKGRNGRFIMEHYVISRNTVKSHIKHIYAKLDVHSQQELIDMVEEKPSEQSRSALGMVRQPS